VQGTVIRQRDSALPAEPPAAAKSGPMAIEADSIATFARDLRVLRAKADLDYPDMAEKSHYTMRTLASAAGGLRLPTLPVLIAYVQACDGDVAEWEDRWARLVKSKRGTAALPAAIGGDDEPAAGAPDPARGPVSTPPPGTANGPGGPGSPGSPGRGGGQGMPPPPQSREVYVITSAPARDPW
jgi:hypothetical protein